MHMSSELTLVIVPLQYGILQNYVCCFLGSDPTSDIPINVPQ